MSERMTRPYNERRNRQIWVLVERRKMASKDVPAELVRRGYGLLTYVNVRKIMSLLRKIHNNSHKFTSVK